MASSCRSCARSTWALAKCASELRGDAARARSAKPSARTISVAAVPVISSRTRAVSSIANQLGVERSRDSVRNLVLQGEQIASIASEALDAQMRVGFGINQLGINTDPVCRSLDISFEHIAHTKLAADLL